MTKQRTLKGEIRDRMKRNNERYTTARAAVLQRRSEPRRSNVQWIGGQQSDVAAATNALNAAGVQGPNGEPLSEAMVFGLAGGIGFLYGVFRYDAGPTMTITTRNSSMPDTFLEPLWSTPGLVTSVSTTGGVKKARSDLEKAVASGARALVSVGAGALPYLGLPYSDAAMMPTVVGVVSIEGNDVLIDDRAPVPHHMTADELAAARRLLRSAKHRLVVIGEASRIDWATALPKAVEEGVARYDTPPVPQFAANVGIAGLKKLHRLLTDPRDTLGWAKVFAADGDAAIGYSRIYECIHHVNTAPSAGRPLYADFLCLVNEVSRSARLTEAAEMVTQSGAHWAAIADLARAADVSITQACEAMDHRAELLDGVAKPPKLAAAYADQTNAIRRCSISKHDADSIRSDIAVHVGEIVELETSALVALSSRATERTRSAKAKRRAAEPGTAEDRVTLLNPNTGRTDKTIARAIYDPVKAAILATLKDQPDLLASALYDEVEARTDPTMWENNKVGWYTIGVKLDLEARGLIERHSSPQKLRLPVNTPGS